jgi:hypothetical protein
MFISKTNNCHMRGSDSEPELSIEVKFAIDLTRHSLYAFFPVSPKGIQTQINTEYYVCCV